MYEKHCNVILASEFCKSKEFRPLFDHIKKHKKFTNIDALEDPKLKKYESTYNMILKQCRLEWIMDQNQSVEKISSSYNCAVCSHKNLVHYCRLRNKINGNVIIVGLDCAMYFNDEDINQIESGIKIR